MQSEIELHRPKNLAEALTLLAHYGPDGKLLAGGTNMVVELRERLRGKTVIWCYAPGYHDGNRVSLDAMRELTSFTLTPFAEPQVPQATATDAGVAAGLEAEAFGSNQPVRPLFQATTPAEQVLARYATGEPAVAWAEDNGGTAVFCGVPRLTPGLLRFAAQRAGVHVWTADNCVLYANGPFVVLHGTKPEPVRLDTGNDREVTDVLAGTSLGKGPVLTVPLGFGETRILRIAE